MKTIFSEYIDRLKKTLDRLDQKAIARLGEMLEKARLSGNGIFIFGNGGSGANASHIAGDFVKGASFGLDQRYRFTCLNDNASGLMATANDIGWDFIFSEPLKGFLRSGDLVIGISGSGNSANVVNGIETAKAMGAFTVAFSGYSGGKIAKLADLSIHVPVEDMEISEDVHLIIAHMVKQALMRTSKPVLGMGSKYDERLGGGVS